MNTHIIPTNDIMPHSDIGLDCECIPRVKVQGADCMIIHNSFDGREQKELDRKIKVN